MQIKLSDYILEQSISDQEVSNILLEQAIAEANVAFSLCDAYLKQCMIEEMLGIEDEDIEDEVVTESDTDTETEAEEVTTESSEDDVTIDDDEEIVTEAAKSKKTKEESEPKAEETSNSSEPKEEKAKTQDKTYGVTNPTKDKASDYKEDEPKEKEPKEKGRVMRALKATFKAIGKFMHVIAVKLGMVNDRIIKNNKRLVHCVNDSSTEEIQELAEHLKKKFKLKTDRELYRYYNFKTCQKILEALDQSTRRFSMFVEGFSNIGSLRSIDTTRSKKDKNNQGSINFMERGLREFVTALHTLDDETSFDIGTAFDPTSNTYRFQDRIRDYIQFWDQRETRTHVTNIIKFMNKISKDVHDLDIRWNYTMDYRGDIFKDISRYRKNRDKIVFPPNATKKEKEAIMKAAWIEGHEKTWKTDLLKDRSQGKAFVEIRSTIHEINAVMNGGGKRSITSRITDMNERYFAVYDFYNNKLLKEREKKNQEKEAS